MNVVGARRAMRLTMALFLETLTLLRSTTGLETTTAIVFLQILDSNTRLIEDVSESSGRFAELPDLPGDELREPVSVYAIAHELDMPYETVRRHVRLLIERGLCRRLGNRGVIVPSQTLARPAMMGAVAANARNVAAFAEAYLDPAGRAAAPRPAD